MGGNGDQLPLPQWNLPMQLSLGARAWTPGTHLGHHLRGSSCARWRVLWYAIVRSAGGVHAAAWVARVVRHCTACPPRANSTPASEQLLHPQALNTTAPTATTYSISILFSFAHAYKSYSSPFASRHRLD